MAQSRLLAVWLCASLARVSQSSPFAFSAPKHACGVCKEVLNGFPCERFGACHHVNASAVAEGCSIFCGEARATALDVPKTPDLRVVRGFGTKGYDQIRISMVSEDSKPLVDGFFDYSGRFQHRWTHYFLHTAMKSVTPGEATDFPLGSGLQVRLPKQGTGVAGVLIGDPCMNGGSILGYISCKYGTKHNTYNRTVELINAFVSDQSTDYWGILGDNFYDRNGELTADVFSRVSWAAKSKFFVTVPGNHDFWIFGTPTVSTSFDQCANGFMQYYAQDSKAAENISAGDNVPPFDLSVNPTTGHHLGYGCNLPAASNMFWYNQIGNVGLVGQSGAHTIEEARPFMAEACQWLAQQPGLEVAVLLGHWDNTRLGVTPEMDMPGWYHDMAALPGCSEFNQTGRLKYVMGHTHCNEPHPRGDVDTGFRVGAFGMEGCGNYGVPVLDTSDSRIRFWYFDTSSDDLYNAVMACVGRKGWRNCLHLATSWLDQPLKQPAQFERLVI